MYMNTFNSNFESVETMCFKSHSGEHSNETFI